MDIHAELQLSALTDRGQVRAQNEDAVCILPDIGAALLADGMGGYRAGEVASRIAINVCTSFLQQGMREVDARSGDRWGRLSRLLRDTVIQANAAIVQASRREPDYAGMGTTLVATLFHHDRLLVAHVGDSRAYRLRGGLLEQVTRDHSHVQEQVDAGLLTPEQARHAPNRNLVTRALGIDFALDVELNQFVTRAGDLYLLCSDGLSDMLDDAQIAALLQADAPLDQSAAALVGAANAAGGMDNVSVVLCRIVSCEPENPGLLGRMLDWVR
jgi:serine/threonine protein phosphatase PrpC